MKICDKPSRPPRCCFPGPCPARSPSAFTGNGRGVAGAARPTSDLGAEPDQRVVLAPGHALLHRDERVVGDLDALRAYLGAALGDVAVAEPEVVLRDLPAVGGIGRVHLEFGDPHQEPGPRERALVLRMVADHMTDVLAQVALDALAEFLRPLHVHLLHPELAEPDRRIRGERRYFPRLR